MGSETTLDRRVIKTKKAIRNAFAELLSERDINEITIKDISDRAIINRKTFYSYYAGVYQLIDEIENEIVATLSEALRNEDFESIAHNPYALFQKLTAIINSDMDFYGFLMQSGHNSNLDAKIVMALKIKIKSSFWEQSGIDEKDFDLALDFVCAGILSVYQSWFNSDRTQSIEMISKTVSIITFSGMNGLLK